MLNGFHTNYLLWIFYAWVHSKLRSVVNVTRITETFSVDISLQTPILVGPWQMAEWMGEVDWVIRQGEKKGWWLDCQQSALKLIGASLAHSTGPRFSPQNELIQVKVSAKSCYLHSVANTSGFVTHFKNYWRGVTAWFSASTGWFIEHGKIYSQCAKLFCF